MNEEIGGMMSQKALSIAREIVSLKVDANMDGILTALRANAVIRESEKNFSAAADIWKAVLILNPQDEFAERNFDWNAKQIKEPSK